MTLVREEFEFYTQHLKRKVKTAKYRSLMRLGAFTRRAARQSMKKRPKKPRTSHGETVRIKSGRNKGKTRFKKGRHSPPGKPPYYSGSYTGINFRDIRFKVANDNDSVVVHTITNRARAKQSKSPPQVHEQGQTVTFPGKRYTDNETKQVFRTDPRTIKFPKRPFMQPAGEKAIVDLNRSIRNSIK